MSEIFVSVVTGTLNRLPMLRGMVESMRPALAGMESETIIVDGASTDGTLEWLRQQPDLTVIEQGKPLGIVLAYEAGFRATKGKYVVNLNDDCLIRGQPIRCAVQELEAHTDIGQFAIPYTTPSIPDKHHVEYVEVGNPGRRLLYANFGVTRRWLGDKLGWWRPDLYRHYCGDSHVSVAIQAEGFRVEICPEGYIDHIESVDSTRHENNQDPPIFQSFWSGVHFDTPTA